MPVILVIAGIALAAALALGARAYVKRHPPMPEQAEWDAGEGEDGGA